MNEDDKRLYEKLKPLARGPSQARSALYLIRQGELTHAEAIERLKRMSESRTSQHTRRGVENVAARTDP